MKYAPYSHTKISIYELCPLKFALQYISKSIPWAENATFERGNYFHWRMKHYPKNPYFGFQFADKDTVAEYDKHFDELIQTPFHQALLEYKIATEYEFYLDENFHPVKNKKDAMILGTIDYIGRKSKETLSIVDYKTGSHDGDDFQLQLYAVWALAASKSTQMVDCMFAYLDQNNFTRQIYARKHEDRLKEKIINKINQIEADTEFCANVGDHCAKCTGLEICKSFMKE